MIWKDPASKALYRYGLEIEIAEARDRLAVLTQRLIDAELEDEELSRLLFGSALPPDPQEPSTNAATEWDA